MPVIEKDKGFFFNPSGSIHSMEKGHDIPWIAPFFLIVFPEQCRVLPADPPAPDK
jgi:hypothetical protein